MTLIDTFKGPCVLMEKKRASDGEGGWTTTWVDGAAFDAAIVRDTALAARVAEKEGVSNVYTVTQMRDSNFMTFSSVSVTAKCSV